ncbi:MAG: UPF0147 family protein [Candidatus Hadarchaeota archaeon]
MSFEEKLKQVVDIMTRVSGDTTVPRNIRRAASEAMVALLKKDEDLVVRAASARITLEEISSDSNMPIHARTQIWSALSILETIK